MNANADRTASRNEAWGFYGTMGEHAKAAWPLAIEAIAKATGELPESARAFLDATPGRHFADEVLNTMHHDKSLTLAAAIEAATRKWMGWKVSASVNRQYGIPRNLPYLTGFVIHCDSVAFDNE